MEGQHGTHEKRLEVSGATQLDDAPRVEHVVVHGTGRRILMATFLEDLTVWRSRVTSEVMQGEHFLEMGEIVLLRSTFEVGSEVRESRDGAPMVKGAVP